MFASRPRLRAIAPLVVALVALLAPLPSPAVDLPPEAASLLPADADAVLVARSLEEADRVWPQFGQGGEGDPKARDKRLNGPRAWLANAAPDLMTYVDPSRPVAFASTIPPPMTGRSVRAVVVFPLLPRARDPYFLQRVGGELKVSLRGEYAAVCSDPTWTPGDTPPALIANLPDAPLAARADLESIVNSMRPVVEMVLAMMPSKLAEAGTDSTGVVVPPRMTHEQVAALQDFARDLMDAVVRLDLALDKGPGGHRLAGALEAAPGSMLDWGPQPDFQLALQLTGMLPADLPLIEAGAMDVDPLIDRLAPFYAALLAMDDQPGLPGADREAAAEWMTNALDLARTWQHPFAMGMSFGPDGMRMQSVHLMPEPEAALETTIARYMALNDFGTGVTITEGPGEQSEGVPIRTFAVKLDPARVPADSTIALPTGMAAMLSNLYPPIKVAAVPGRALVAMDRDPTAMASLIARSRTGQAAIHPQLASFATNVDPGTRMVAAGNLSALITGVLSFAARAAEETATTPTLEPVPFTATTGLRGLEHLLSAEVDLDRLAASMETLGKAFPDQKEKPEPTERTKRRPRRDVSR